MEERVTIGHLMRPHGLKGQIKCMPETHDLRRHEKLHRVFAVRDGAETELHLESSSTAGNLWLLKFQGYDSPESLAALTNADLRIPLSERIPAPEGQYYFSDLEGFDAIGSRGQSLGKILSVEALPTVNAFVLRYRGKEIFAPWIEGCVGEIDMEKHSVSFSEAYLDQMIAGGKSMKIDCITIFPEMFAPMQHSIMGRAQDKGILDFHTIYLRDFAINEYGQVDDSPYGGEPGMVLRPEPLKKAIDSTHVREDGGKVIYLTADGVPFSHRIAQDLSRETHLVMLCGHYKGIDERIRETEVDMEISIGDFVVSGGELPAMVVADAVVRLLDGALGDRLSGETDSFAQGTLGWPVYTRPEIFEGKSVPEVLLSGHHKKIREWQTAQSLKRTQERRPDIYEKLKTDTKFGIK